MKLTIGNISKTYPNVVRALQNVNLKIPAHIFGLPNPNGKARYILRHNVTTLQELAEGEFFLKAEPMRTIERWQARVWHRVVERRMLLELELENSIIILKLLVKKLIECIYSNLIHGNRFKLTNANLEDILYSTISGYFKQYQGKLQQEVVR